MVRNEAIRSSVPTQSRSLFGKNNKSKAKLKNLQQRVLLFDDENSCQADDDDIVNHKNKLYNSISQTKEKDPNSKIGNGLLPEIHLPIE